MIHGRMRASKPKTMQDAMEIATKLRNKKISTLVECETENKKRTPATAKNQRTRTCYECGSLRHYKSDYPIMKFHKHMDMIHGRKIAPKRTTRANPTTTTTTTTTFMTDAQLEALIEHGIAKELAARDADRNINGDDNHVSGTCARRTERVTRECTYPDFMKCKPLNFKGTEGVVELTQWFEKMETVFRISNCSVENQIMFSTCTHLGRTFQEDCPKFKNNNHGTQSGNATALAKVYAVGRAGTNLDSNVVTGTFLLNNRYASILFDTGAYKSFVSTAFSSQIAITPTILDHYYDVKLADRRIIRLNSILRVCTLNFLNHPFNIDIIPVELGSFDAIVGMDWLAKYHAVIVCVEKIVRIP
nr:putative reverse transcriptase domain-containing protein [Tanacetum cinerariifolium]